MNYESFENAFTHLQNIVQKFEDTDNISIDDLLTSYEDAMKAYAFCMKKLEDTQKKIKIIESNYE